MEVKEESRGYAFLSSRPTQEVPFGSKKTAVGVIPADWMICALGSFCEISAGGDLVKEDFSKEMDQRHPFPVFSNALSRSGLYGYSASSKHEPDCITVTARGDVGHAYYRSEKFCAIGRVLVISSKQQQACDLRFVTECINNLIEFALESTGVPQLTAPQIAKYEVPLPPSLGEQEAIADALSDADALIESLEQLIAKKRQIKQGTMQALLTGKQRLPGFGGKWKTIRLGELANVKTGSRNNQDKVGDGLYPFFVRSDTVERINSFSHDCEAILVPGEGRVGEIFHYINGRFDVHQRVYAITQFLEGVSGRYIHLYMAEHFGRHAMENSVKATVDSLRLPTFQEFEVRLPSSIEEQSAIATILTDMDTELAELETRLAKTRQLKQGMMRALLTGRIRLV